METKREIKFRAWDGEQMVSPDYIDRDGIAFWEENSIPTKSDIVMQYTTQFYNGVQLCESDIVEIEYNEQAAGRIINPFNENLNTPSIRLICVYGFDDSFHLSRIDDNSFASYSVRFGGSAVKSKKIIGNRYEHPSLLQKG